MYHSSKIRNCRNQNVAGRHLHGVERHGLSAGHGLGCVEKLELRQRSIRMQKLSPKNTVQEVLEESLLFER